MKEIYGRIKDIKPFQLQLLKDLADEYVATNEFISISLAKKLSHISFITRRLLGLLIDRKGQVRWVIIGDNQRLYLPDIGRIRGAKGRLRGLRLIVARPNPLPFGQILSNDFKTDLEKLRLDAVLEMDASRDEVLGPIALGILGSENIKGQEKLLVRESSYSSIKALKEDFSSVIKEAEKEFIDASKSFKEHGAILVGIYTKTKKEGILSMEELSELARSASVQVSDKILQWRQKLDPRTLVGSGKLEEICLHALSLGVETIIFDCDLSPSQLLYITDLTDLKVLDRTMLILDIFAQRAKTKEGKLQVEMAQLTYSLPRLKEKQTGLSRLTGGIGGRGPGETKLEINRRRVKDRLANLEKDLKEIKKQREHRRKKRKDKEMPILAIVGYTNAGKSTLLNALTGSNIYAKDELFATLDPHSRRLRFPKEKEVIITDTVGFINNLPQSLMKAFMATLEELNEADLLLHVVDISNDNYRNQIKIVEDILTKLDLINKKRLIIFNKIDLLNNREVKERTWGLDGILISAEENIGLKELIEACSSMINED